MLLIFVLHKWGFEGVQKSFSGLLFLCFIAVNVGLLLRHFYNRLLIVDCVLCMKADGAMTEASIPNVKKALEVIEFCSLKFVCMSLC